jgi:hypothetical protein
MKTIRKPMYVTSTTLSKSDGDGKIIINKVVKNDGVPVILRFIIRTDSDIQRNRLSAYPVLVP